MAPPTRKVVRKETTERNTKKPGRAKVRNTSTREKLIRKALLLIERRLDREDINSSLGDLIRLLELTEPARNEPVCAGWVDDDGAIQRLSD